MVEYEDVNINGTLYKILQNTTALKIKKRPNKFPLTVSQVTHSELKADLLPNDAYRRSDDDIIPSEFDGITFYSQFGIGGHDKDTLSTLIPILRDGTHIVSIAHSGQQDEITRLEQPAIDKVKAQLSEIEKATAEHKLCNVCDTMENGTKQSEPYIPFIDCHLKKNASGDREVSVLIDYYDGGTISLSTCIPSISAAFRVYEHEYTNPYSDEKRSETKWQYDVYLHTARRGKDAPFIALPKEQTVKAAYLSMQGTILSMLDQVCSYSPLSLKDIIF